MENKTVLIADDETTIRKSLAQVLGEAGFRTVTAADGLEAVRALEEMDIDMVLLDIRMPGLDGLGVLAKAKEISPETQVIIITAFGSVENAVEAIKLGANDYVIKPFVFDDILIKVRRLLGIRQLTAENAVLREELQSLHCFEGIVGASDGLRKVLDMVQKLTQTRSSVLITGESGTGKELVSYYVHRASSRRQGPYVRVNCAALSESLLESELFGHERGAFTGAVQQRKGRFERAHGGTLLLDEISETTPRLQAELLRVLEQQDFERVGGSELVRVNVRVVCTSNRDLAAAVQHGGFRRDLYYRISGVHLTVPPLRQRPEDLPVLVWHFVNLYAREVRRPIDRLDPAMLEAFTRHTWPGNVRELRNVVRTALILGEGPTLALAKGQDLARGTLAAGAAASTSLSLQELERQAIFEALRRTKSHQAKAAMLLGITDRTLREKLRRYRQDGQSQPVGETSWLADPA
jgi:DNA-binding NtrC family response regulator